MINAKELRIGNWIVGALNYRMQIVLGCQIDHYISTYYPITLTPEILESCGFKYDSEEMGDSLAEFYINGDFIWAKGIKEMYFKHTPLPHIEYLHQLQNLYFALTGQELNVNLNELQHDKNFTN